MSGVLVCVAAGSALLVPFLQAAIPNRRLMGLSIGRYTLVGVLVMLALAAAIAVIAFAGSQE
jgi:hypothetical protein